MRTEYSRTIDAMQENAPSAKTPTSAIFSRPGRWMLRRTLMGKTRIHTSITMLVELVTDDDVSEVC